MEEQSILDFFVVCSRVLPFVSRMVVDSDKKHILTNYKHAKNGIRATDSDHLTEYIDVKLKIIPEKPLRREILNFKNKKYQAVFKSNTVSLSSSISGRGNNVDNDSDKQKVYNHSSSLPES